MISSDIVPMDDLIEYSLFKLKEKEMGISKYMMQKFIFKIKMDLGENHELFDELPYYWYFHGPFSEILNDSWNCILPKCDFFSNSIKIKEDYYKNFKIENNLVSSYLEIDDIINHILDDEKAFYSIDRLIYKEYAPYTFMYSFKYGIFDIAQNVRSTNDFNVSDYIDIFHNCESQLPCESYFNDFSDLFSKLSLNLDLINDENNFNKSWNFLRNPIVELWKTFARGLRVNFKDDYYDSRVDSWNRKFKSSIDELTILIDETDKLVNLDNYSNDNYSPSQKKLLNATISAYLRG